MQSEPTASPSYRYVYRRRRWRPGAFLPLLFAIGLMGASFRMAFPPQKALRQRNALAFLGSLPSATPPPPPSPAAVLGRRYEEVPALGTPHSVRIFPSGMPLRPIVEELQKLGLPVDSATPVERQKADLILRPATAAFPAGASLVSPAGQVTLSVPREAAQSRPIFASHLRAPRLPMNGGLYASPGLEREYDQVAAIASVAVRTSQRLGNTASLPSFANTIPKVRLIPELTVLNAGESQGFDFQIEGAGGEWYSLTDRQDVRFQVYGQPGLVVPHDSVRGVFCSPAETSPRYDGERVTIEAVINSLDLPRLAARALVIIRVPPSPGR